MQEHTKDCLGRHQSPKVFLSLSDLFSHHLSRSKEMLPHLKGRALKFLIYSDDLFVHIAGHQA